MGPAWKVTPSVGKVCLTKMNLMSSLQDWPSPREVPDSLMVQLEQAREGGSSREGRGPGVGRERLLSRPLDPEGRGQDEESLGERSRLALPTGLVKQLLFLLSACFLLRQVCSFLNEVAFIELQGNKPAQEGPMHWSWC